jgi:hypothetical protein
MEKTNAEAYNEQRWWVLQRIRALRKVIAEDQRRRLIELHFQELLGLPPKPKKPELV